MTGRKVFSSSDSPVAEEQAAEFLPSCRIQCHPGCIKIGNKEYQSASEALNAYLDQFDYQLTNSTYKSIPSLGTSSSREQKQKLINDEIQKAKQDLKIHLLKKALDKSQKREQSYLQREVDDALTKSGNLLDRLNTSDESLVQCASDIGSLTTDVLLTINPYQSLKHSESKHIYSYHRTSRPHSRSTDTAFQRNQKNHDLKTETSSIDSKLPPTGLSTNKSKVVLDNHNQSIKKSLRSRSVSPNAGKSNFKTPSWVQELDSSMANGPPSWIDGLAPSDISDSIWTEKQLSQHRTHSIIDDNKLMTLTEESYSSNPPGLEISDLNSKNPNSKPQSFSELRLYTAKVISDADKFLKATEVVDSDVSMEFNQNNISSPKPKVLHTTLDRYIADMSSPFSGKKDSDSVENMPRCSSMDTMMGEISAPKSDITGASTIPMASNTVTPKKAGKPTVTFSPHNIGKSPNSSVVLDGDRPWEYPPTQLKPPVYIEDINSLITKRIPDSPTLSGGQQPGSMEALKKMLFKLQAENTSVQSNSNICEINPAEDLDMPALKGYNFQSEPGGHSLEKALVHLTRLKNLVERKEPLQEETNLNKSYSAPSSPRR